MLSVFFSSKCSLFHNSNVFGPCIIHILYTGCAKIKKNSGAKRLMYSKYAWEGRDMHASCWAISLKGCNHFVDLLVDSG